MENYIVSARKYRPVTFSSVVGQGSLTVTLKNAIQSGKLAHAYLFCGPRGVGKTTCARIFAKTINCQNLQPNGEACDQCDSCQSFNDQRSFNIHELDAASNNSVDDIRNLIEEVRIPPQMGKYKVFIIDEVHMLSSAAFNAFLKTLEEPPHHAIFILATTEKHKILPTILSRCQIFDFNRMSVPDTVRHLQYVAQQEGVQAEEQALNVIAQKADGGMRDALSIFDQVVSFTGGQLTYDRVIENLNVLDYDYYFKLVDCFLDNQVHQALLLFNDILNKGFQGDHFIQGLSQHLRDLLVSRDAVTLSLLEVGDAVKPRYQQQAARCNPKFLYAALKLCNECDLNYRASKNKRLLVELALIQCAQLTQPDEAEAGGRKPCQVLKPIFNKLQVVENKPISSASVSVSQPQPVQPVVEKTAPVQPAVVSPVATTTTKSTGPTVFNLNGIKLKTSKVPISITRFNMEAQQATATQQPTVAIPQVPKLHEPATQDKLRFYWNELLQILPNEDRAISSRMEIMQPVLLDADTFEVVVDNPQVEKDMQAVKSRIEQHLRKGLQNDYLQMRIRVAQLGEFKPILSPKERLDNFCEMNPAIRKLRDQLHLMIR